MKKSTILHKFCLRKCYFPIIVMFDYVTTHSDKVISNAEVAIKLFINLQQITFTQ